MVLRVRDTLLVIVGIVAVLLVAGLGVLVIQGRKPPNRTAQLVALGSSFAAGLGLGPRLKDSHYACLKGSSGYPQPLAKLLNLSLVDMTCSGATTSQVLHGGQYFRGAQIDALSENTQLVTLTTGGNDVSYVSDLISLAARSRRGALGWLLRLSPKKLKRAEERDSPKLHDVLLATLKEIHRRAPRARIVVVTYPAILPPVGTCPTLGISADDATIMRHVGDRLAELTRTSAHEAGVEVVDMATLSQGHDACSSSPWANGAAPKQGAKFHPTLAGASATALAIQNAVQEHR